LPNIFSKAESSPSMLRELGSGALLKIKLSNSWRWVNTKEAM
jgi:hypothetical protein